MHFRAAARCGVPRVAAPLPPRRAASAPQTQGAESDQHADCDADGAVGRRRYLIHRRRADAADAVERGRALRVGRRGAGFLLGGVGDVGTSGTGVGRAGEPVVPDVTAWALGIDAVVQAIAPEQSGLRCRRCTAPHWSQIGAGSAAGAVTRRRAAARGARRITGWGGGGDLRPDHEHDERQCPRCRPRRARTLPERAAMSG